MTITLNLPPEEEGKSRQAAQLQGKDVTAFLLDSVRQQLRCDVLPEAEASLLQIINAPLAPQARQERDALLTLQTQRELTASEQETLTHLFDTVNSPMRDGGSASPNLPNDAVSL